MSDFVRGVRWSLYAACLLILLCALLWVRRVHQRYWIDRRPSPYEVLLLQNPRTLYGNNYSPQGPQKSVSGESKPTLRPSEAGQRVAQKLRENRYRCRPRVRPTRSPTPLTREGRVAAAYLQARRRGKKCPAT